MGLRAPALRSCRVTKKAEAVITNPAQDNAAVLARGLGETGSFQRFAARDRP